MGYLLAWEGRLCEMAYQENEAEFSGKFKNCSERASLKRRLSQSGFMRIRILQEGKLCSINNCVGEQNDCGEYDATRGRERYEWCMVCVHQNRRCRLHSSLNSLTPDCVGLVSPPPPSLPLRLFSLPSLHIAAKGLSPEFT